MDCQLGKGKIRMSMTLILFGESGFRSVAKRIYLSPPFEFDKIRDTGWSLAVQLTQRAGQQPLSGKSGTISPGDWFDVRQRCVCAESCTQILPSAASTRQGVLLSMQRNGCRKIRAKGDILTESPVRRKGWLEGISLNSKQHFVSGWKK